MIEGVEKLRAELDVAAFTQKTNRCPLDDRDVRVVLARAGDYADAAIAKIGASARFYQRPGRRVGRQARSEWSVGIGAGDAVGVEVIRPTARPAQPAAHRAGSNQIGVRATGSDLHPVTDNPKGITIVGTEKAQRQTRLDRGYARNRPAAEQIIDKGIEPFRAGQVIDIAKHKPVLAVGEDIAAIIGTAVILISGKPKTTGISDKCVIVGTGESISSQKLQPLREPLCDAGFQDVVPGRSR